MRKTSSASLFPARHLVSPPGELAFNILTGGGLPGLDRLIGPPPAREPGPTLLDADSLHDRQFRIEPKRQERLHFFYPAPLDHAGEALIRPGMEDVAVRIEEYPVDLDPRQHGFAPGGPLPVIERLAGSLEDL